MAIGNPIGNPVQELIDQLWVGVAARDALANLLTKQISGMGHFRRVVHVADIAGPQYATVDNAEQTLERRVVIQGFPRCICIEFLDNICSDLYLEA